MHVEKKIIPPTPPPGGEGVPTWIIPHYTTVWCVCADLGVPACLCGLAALHSTSYQWALPCNRPKSCAGTPPARPALRKIKQKALSRAGKVHKCTLSAFTCCIRHLGKHFLAQILPILASFGRFMGPKRLKNCAVHLPNIDKDASKSPKNGVWGHFGFGGHFYPFWTDL